MAGPRPRAERARSVFRNSVGLTCLSEEMAKRRAKWTPVEAEPRGYAKLYQDHVLQAEDGCDFDFLRAV